MARGRPSAKTRIAEYLAGRPAGPISAEEFASLAERLAPVSQTYLRRLLRQSGVELEPVVEGVRQESLQQLHRSLLALAREYRLAKQSGDRARQQLCRRLVIEAKDHARWALRRAKEPSDARTWRQEAIEWMRVWLENPEVFPLWSKLRLRQMGETISEDASCA
jgi:hypothetical protein